jgi:hypothetical protein
MEFAAQLPHVAAALRESNVDCSMLSKLDDEGLRELGILKRLEREAAQRKIGIALLGIGELPPPPMVEDVVPATGPDESPRQFGAPRPPPHLFRRRFFHGGVPVTLRQCH